MADPSALDLSIGLVYCVLGALLLGGRGRGTACGLLLFATGAAWLLGAAVPAAVLAYRGPLTHLLVTFPHSWPKRRAARVVIGLGYLGMLGPVGGNPAVSVCLALIVAATVVDGRRRATGADRRARTTSTLVAVPLMATLTLAGFASAAGIGTGPWLFFTFELLMLAGGVGLFADTRWGRWDDAALETLVLDLGGPGTVRDALGQALGDPDLEIAFVDGAGGLLDEQGRPTPVLQAGVDRQLTLLSSGGEDIAVVAHAKGLLDDQALRDSAAALTKLAYANTRLQAEALTQVSELEGSRRRLLDTANQERAWLEAELRAGAGRRLATVQNLLAPDHDLAVMVRDALTSLADFARGVHPRVLTQSGLAVACEQLSGAARTPVTLDVEDLRGVRLPEDVELTLYFVCAEALTNIDKHAHASRADVGLRRAGDLVRLTVQDNGIGLGNSPANRSSTGLVGLADRLAVVSGVLRLDGRTPEGTTLVAEVPFEAATAHPDGQRGTSPILVHGFTA